MTMKEKRRLIVELGKQIRALRKMRHLTQAELAPKIGLSRVSVVNIECGRQGSVHIYRLVDIARALGVPLSRLLRGIV